MYFERFARAERTRAFALNLEDFTGFPHDAPVAPEVWALYRRFIERAGPKPTLIERDGNVPGFDELLAERQQAAAALARPPENARP